MSRSGRIPINIPDNTEVRSKMKFFAKGKLGELSFAFKSNAKVEIKDNTIIVKSPATLFLTKKCGNSKIKNQQYC